MALAPYSCVSEPGFVKENTSRWSRPCGHPILRAPIAARTYLNTLRARARVGADGADFAREGPPRRSSTPNAPKGGICPPSGGRAALDRKSTPEVQYLKPVGPSVHVARPIVLDTSALLAGRPLGPDEDTIVPASVLTELRPGGRDRRHLDHLLAAGARLSDADPQLRKKVEEEARRGGDHARLSRVDLDVLTVALQMDAELRTDDYTIQNVARRLGIPTRSIHTAGIRETYAFSTRCNGCRQFLDKPSDECPICGSPTHTVRDRRGAPAAPDRTDSRSGSKPSSSRPR